LPALPQLPTCFFKVQPTNERIDLEQLKVKEKIYFYEDVILYEDELADNGIAKLNVKMVITGYTVNVLLFTKLDF